MLPARQPIRFSFPAAFTPKPGPLGAVMLRGWSRGPIAVKFTTVLDSEDPRTVIIHFRAGDRPRGLRPGFKAILCAGAR